MAPERNGGDWNDVNDDDVKRHERTGASTADVSVIVIVDDNDVFNANEGSTLRPEQQQQHRHGGHQTASKVNYINLNEKRLRLRFRFMSKFPPCDCHSTS